MRSFFVRWGTVLFLVFTAVVFVGAGFVMASIGEEEKTVSFTERTLYGDRSLLDGLHIELCYALYESVSAEGLEPGAVWLNELEFTSDSFQKTTNHFFTKDYWSDQRLNISHYSKTSGFIYAPYIDSDAIPNMEYDKVYRFRDYEQYYDIDLHNFSNHTLDSLNQQRLKESLDLLEQKFRIPIYEDSVFHYTATVSGIEEFKEDSEGWYGDRYWAEINAVESDNYCMLWFNNKTAHGNYVDASEMPGGYGVYIVPVSRKQKKGKKLCQCVTEYKSEEFENICPINPEFLILDVQITGDEKTALILTSENHFCYLTAVDIQSKTQKGRIKLFKIGENEYRWSDRDVMYYTDIPNGLFDSVVCTEQGLVVEYDYTIYFANPNADGEWNLLMNIPIFGLEESGPWEMGEVWDYDEINNKEFLLQNLYVYHGFNGMYTYQDGKLILAEHIGGKTVIAVYQDNQLKCCTILEDSLNEATSKMFHADAQIEGDYAEPNFSTLSLKAFWE